MDATKFLSSGKYFLLPNQRQPKVYLSFDENSFLENAIKLYNPFSRKGKFFKSLIVFLIKNMKIFISIFFPILKVQQSEFSKYLDNVLGAKFTISVYKSTDLNKVVLQLQDEKSNIYGYLKYPITKVGKQRVLNEKYGIHILSNLKIVDKLLFYGSYQDTPFIILKNIDGVINRLPVGSHKKVLKSLYREKKFTLKKHPRIIDLLDRLKVLGLDEYHALLQRLIQTSNASFKQVYEHGDFAPWNLIQTSKDYVPFDFEYFVENGLEYLDEIKYHFQIQHLLHGKSGVQLVNAIASKVYLGKEFSLIFQIFLINEIIKKHEISKPIDFESLLLKKVSSEEI